MRSFLDYLDNDIGWRNRGYGRSRVNEGVVELARNADIAGLLINTSGEKLNVNDRRYCIAPRSVVKLLASRKITFVMEVEQDELDEIVTTNEMYDFLREVKGVPVPIAKMIAYDLWYARDPDTPVVIDPARYHIEIEDDAAFIRNAMHVFRKILSTTHSLSPDDGGVQVYVKNGGGGYHWIVPSDMGIY